jgi:hypothetical protein
MEQILRQASNQILITEMMEIYNNPDKDVFDRYSAAKAIATELGQNLEGRRLKYWFKAFINQQNQPQTDLF